MRFHELIGAEPTRRLSGAGNTSKPNDGDLLNTLSRAHLPKLVIRLMPAVYRELPLKVRPGASEAEISLERVVIWFSTPFDDEQQLTAECREFIIQAVSRAVGELRFRMCIVFDEGDVVFVENEGDLVSADRPPTGGLRL